MPRVGVLALQGDFAEHLQVLRRLEVESAEVRLPGDMAKVDALILPGGESTTIRRLMDRYGLSQAISERVRGGMPVWGTCAGMIVLARGLTEDRPEPLGLMDIVVARNAFGRQVDSFEEDLPIPTLGKEPFHAVFIRAPVIRETGEGVEVLASLANGTPVAARQGHMLVTAFHPELTDDPRLHAYFLRWVRKG